VKVFFRGNRWARESLGVPPVSPLPPAPNPHRELLYRPQRATQSAGLKNPDGLNSSDSRAPSLKMESTVYWRVVFPCVCAGGRAAGASRATPERHGFMWLHRNGSWVQPVKRGERLHVCPAEREESRDDGGGAPSSRAPVPRSRWTSRAPSAGSRRRISSSSARRLSSPNEALLSPLVLDNDAWLFLRSLLSFTHSYHFRTFSIAAMTRLMSSFARLRVSARTDLPDIAAVGMRSFCFFQSSRRQFRHNANSRAHRRATAHARPDRPEREGRGCSCAMKAAPSPCGGCVRVRVLENKENYKLLKNYEKFGVRWSGHTCGRGFYSGEDAVNNSFIGCNLLNR